MNGKALGIIETVGFVPAVEAGDVAVKTADVTLIGSQAVGGGLVSILMNGDVAAVKASIDAGSQAASRLGEVVSVTVIARTAEGLDGILIEEAKRPKCVPEPKKAQAPAEPAAEAVEDADAAAPVVDETPAVEPEAEGETPDAEPLECDLSELKKLKVTKLRRLARQIPTFGIARGEIKFAKKKDLLEAFDAYIKSLS